MNFADDLVGINPLAELANPGLKADVGDARRPAQAVGFGLRRAGRDTFHQPGRIDEPCARQVLLNTPELAHLQKALFDADRFGVVAAFLKNLDQKLIGILVIQIELRRARPLQLGDLPFKRPGHQARRALRRNDQRMQLGQPARKVRRPKAARRRRCSRPASGSAHRGRLPSSCRGSRQGGLRIRLQEMTSRSSRPPDDVPICQQPRSHRKQPMRHGRSCGRIGRGWGRTDRRSEWAL